MYFDFVKKLKIPGDNTRLFKHAQNLWKTCCSAEESVRTDPNQAVKYTRDAEDILVKGLLKEDGYMDIQDFVPLKSLIETYSTRCLFISDKCADELQELRKKVNGSAHANPHYTIEKAFRYVKELYGIIARIFGVNVPDLELEQLPIGKYSIIDRVKAAGYESVCGGYNYIGKNENRSINTYVYIRPFSGENERNRKVFNERDIEVQKFFKNMRGSLHVIRADEIPTISSCEMRYLAYEIQENTKTLNQIENTLSPKDLLEVIAQVAQGLSELASPKINIHHRGIRPTCIFVTEYIDGLDAKLGCFETAKIEYKEKTIETVYSYTKEAYGTSIFVHPQLRTMENVTGPQWEAGDVYALAAIILNSLDSEAFDEGNIDYSILTEYFSDEFVAMMTRILVTGALEVIPPMKEFYEMLSEEVENGED